VLSKVYRNCLKYHRAISGRSRPGDRAQIAWRDTALEPGENGSSMAEATAVTISDALVHECHYSVRSFRPYLLFSRTKALAIVISRHIPHPVIFLCTPMPPSDEGWCPLSHGCRPSSLQPFVTDSSSADPHNSLPYSRTTIFIERRRPLRLLTLMCVLRPLLRLLMCRSFTLGIGLIGYRGVEGVGGGWRRALTLSSVQIPQVLGSWRRHGTGYQRGRWWRWRSFGPLHVARYSSVYFTRVLEITSHSQPCRVVPPFSSPVPVCP
jgi:hypothetical protein